MNFASAPRFSIVLIILLLTHPVIAMGANDDKQAYLKKLKNISQQITKVSSALHNDRSKQSKLRSELKRSEKDISQSSKKLLDIETKLKKKEQSLSSLQTELGKLNSELSAQKNGLADQLRAAHAFGNHHPLKLVLNQHSPAELGRSLVYYQYLNHARQEKIGEFNLAITQQMALETQILSDRQALEALLKTQKANKEQLNKQRNKKQNVLASLNKQIKNNESALSRLRKNQNEIEALLNSFGEILSDTPEKPGLREPFAKMKGRLPWPVKGKIITRFGTSRQQSELRWNGVVIGSAYGTQVKVIADGRVAFSDWLQGYGFITIVDHGAGYMSLYGHNQTQLKQPGDWVQAGEVIATVGDSGGHTQSGLYFEIRKNGKPDNPIKWCSNNASFVANR